MIIYLTQAFLDLKQWNYKNIYIIQILKMNHDSKQISNLPQKKMVDAEEKANGNNVGSQEQKNNQHQMKICLIIVNLLCQAWWNVMKL